MKVEQWVLKPMIQAVRRDLYAPLRLLSLLPVDPLRYVALTRLILAVDAPLRRVLLGGAYGAKTTG